MCRDSATIRSDRLESPTAAPEVEPRLFLRMVPEADPDPLILAAEVLVSYVVKHVVIGISGVAGL